ncbi:hypothetical protein [Nocardia sp. XZ_19_385]|uniref:hypothetical protein n=1 Tax=Nocardia sp. XZ_19_385 TaxID=2769488 RepID=UPI001890850B|nr:hypothetical protein [Nocardia sp. XZ_19_385]
MLAPDSSLDTRSEVLASAAFGATPGRAAAELPTASGGLDSWHRAVALGGQGHYAAARAELRRLRTRTTDPVLRSLATSTEGSLLRQLGWHAEASAFDGRAAALALPLDPRTPGRTAAVCDALTGLAADALGTGRLALSERLLRRGEVALDAEPSAVHWRARIRWHWVSAETALALGAGRHARQHAEIGLELAEACPSVRHQVKSRLLFAAASMAAGDLDLARTQADIVAAQCRENALVPLRWACAMLRTGLFDTAASAEAQACSDVISRRGGHFR